jgi:large subunit ribosomal protein L15
MLKLHTLKPNKGAKTSTRRLGRGPGSGRGKTSGKGTKGQRARTGGRNKLRLLGMKMIIRRIPKLRGFKSQYAKDEVVTLRDLQKNFPQGGIVTRAQLVKRELLSSLNVNAKVVGSGDVARKLTLKGLKVSAGAKAAIEKAGGSIQM